MGPRAAEAPTLVLLHEGLGCVALWRDVPERLAAATGWGVFAYSRFGYGHSDPTPLPRPMTYMHDEAPRCCRGCCDAAGIADAVLIGHSDGGSIAAIYAGATRRRTGDRAASSRSPRISSSRTSTSPASADPRTSMRPATCAQRLARYHPMWTSRSAAGTTPGWTRASAASTSPASCPPSRCRSWRLQGADDPYGTDGATRSVCAPRPAPRSGRELIPGARHSPHLEAKDATLAAITRFVATLRSFPHDRFPDRPDAATATGSWRSTGRSPR